MLRRALDHTTEHR